MTIKRTILAAAAISLAAPLPAQTFPSDDPVIQAMW